MELSAGWDLAPFGTSRRVELSALKVLDRILPVL